MNAPSKFSLKLDSNLNRSIVHTTYINSVPINFAVMFSARSSALQFHYDSFNESIRNRKVTVNMYRALDNCDFSKMFLESNSYENDNNDVRHEYIGTNQKYSKYIAQFIGESLSFRTHQVNTSRKKVENCVNLYGWKLIDADYTYAFYLVERKFPNFITKKNVVRTCAIQFSTKEGLSTLKSYVDMKKNIISKLNKNEYPDFIENLEPSSEEELRN